MRHSQPVRGAKSPEIARPVLSFCLFPRMRDYFRCVARRFQFSRHGFQSYRRHFRSAAGASDQQSFFPVVRRSSGRAVVGFARQTSLRNRQSRLPAGGGHFARSHPGFQYVDDPSCPAISISDFFYRSSCPADDTSSFPMTLRLRQTFLRPVTLGFEIDPILFGALRMLSERKRSASLGQRTSQRRRSGCRSPHTAYRLPLIAYRSSQ